MLCRKTLRIILLFTLTCLLPGCSEPAHLSPLPADAVILAFGDSLTYGTGASRDNSYPALLQNLLKRRVINAGIPGEVSRAGLQRLPALLQQHTPQLVILCHGGNDILRKHDMRQTRHNLQQMINLIRLAGSEVVLIAVPEFSLWLKPAPFYAELARENKIPLLEDSLSDILAQSRLKADRVHPNDAGYLQLATDIYQRIAEAGGTGD